MEDVIIRKMEIDDIPQVVEVEKSSFPTPWSTDIFYQEIIENQFSHYYVMEYGEKIIGYVGMWIVIDDAQITTIAISPEYRRKKLGEKLFGFSLQTALAMGAKVLSLEVRVSNIPAQKLYRKFGLMPGGIRKNYYTDNGEDAIVMWVNLS
ncbi:putative ribosomal-protein-alanine acetyltransferase [Compostibacillus humi]|jgi:ribosomal-protein-alanine N-acetyltransferase|uniref:[Ribosomal protein bS18]-alanine N-acetyltransferase n=1 Tax=Compostibacillus humi TaxID=1245525 RepID=A0A8J2X914_9BACI|nr:ribosomal protein S18-alanine N-acetyltransferase [Compostibacillus humi]GFZ77798.1 putative ribosomal-protein-alanine acetyltransferase [Compostibacillus humi]HLT56668.1 ribosomal protein S18-alanine N-acetyltransferase [Bacillota bacterium]